MSTDTITFTAHSASSGVLSGVPGAAPAAVGNGSGFDIDQLAAGVRRRIADRLPDGDAAVKEAAAVGLIRGELDQLAEQAMRASRPVPPAEVEQAVQTRVLAVLFGLGALQELLDDPDIENVFHPQPRRLQRHAQAPMYEYL
jgi:hypothetical protein